MADSTEKQPADDKVTVIMRGHARGHKAGQRRRVSQAEADALVANKHADLPKSKQ